MLALPRCEHEALGMQTCRVAVTAQLLRLLRDTTCLAQQVQRDANHSPAVLHAATS